MEVKNDALIRALRRVEQRKGWDNRMAEDWDANRFWFGAPQGGGWRLHRRGSPEGSSRHGDVYDAEDQPPRLLPAPQPDARVERAPAPTHVHRTRHSLTNRLQGQVIIEERKN